MFTLTKSPREATALDKAIEDLFSELQSVNADTEEYSAMADQLIKLMKLKKEVEPSWRVSPDVLVAAGANVLGILLILNFERAGVVASKALGFVGKLVK
jgi:hypothetical protein